LIATGSGLSVFVIDTSGPSTVVAAVAVLFAGVLSLGEDTVAEFVIDPGVLGAVTTIVMFGAAPGARLPPVRLQVTVPDTLLQVQFERAVALTKVVPAGIVSTTLTADASSGPAFDTPMVYVNVPLMNTGSGESVFVIDRSARPPAMVSDPPLVDTDWFVPEGGLLAFVLGSDETRYVPDVQFGVTLNWTVTKPLFGIEPPGIRMNPSVTMDV
jgi:hypothetical protein